MEVVWTATAQRQFEQAYNYIKIESPLNAEKFKDFLLRRVSIVARAPAASMLEKYKKNNDGSYRCFEAMSYRVSFRVEASVLRVIRLRHTARNPLPF